MRHNAHSALTVPGDYQPRLASIVAVLITTVSLPAALFLFLSFTAAPADLASVNGMKSLPVRQQLKTRWCSPWVCAPRHNSFT